ncbi:MAG: hypothetical protein DRO11_06475 [Methanobacteriota archaeon]|nr:MAG: hypothetical protein DRO11_06475 [Euryarchaeota archaeon]
MKYSLQAVILCAGRGSRFGKRGPKPVARLLGIPIVEHTIRKLSAHVEEFVLIVSRDNQRKIEGCLGDGSRIGVKIVYVINEHPERENGYSLWLAQPYIRGRFILAMGDHYYDVKLLEKLLDGFGKPGFFVVGDPQPGGSQVKEAEATKIFSVNNKLVDIGKNIPRWNYFDTGLFILEPTIFKTIERLGRVKQAISVSDVVLEHAKTEPFFLLSSDGHLWMDIDTLEDLRRLEEKLRSGFFKRDDGFISKKFNRKISIRVSTMFARFGVTPNQLTVLLFFFTFVPFTLFVLQKNILAGVFTQILSVLDGCDGEIARIKNITTRSGGFLDSILDRYGDALIILGIVVGYKTAQVSAIGLLAIAGSFLISYTNAKKEAVTGTRFRGFASQMGRDMRLFLIMLGGVTGYLVETLLLLVVLTHLVVALRIAEMVHSKGWATQAVTSLNPRANHP